MCVCGCYIPILVWWGFPSSIIKHVIHWCNAKHETQSNIIHNKMMTCILLSMTWETFLCSDEVFLEVSKHVAHIFSKPVFDQNLVKKGWEELIFFCLLLSPRPHPIFVNNFDHNQNTSVAAPGALAHRLQRRTACKIQNGRQGPQNGRRGLERGPTLGYWPF